MRGVRQLLISGVEGTGPGRVRRLRARLLQRLGLFVCYAPPVVGRLFFGESQRASGVGLLTKASLARTALRNSRSPDCASTFLEQLTIVNEILAIPSSLEGDVAEFGCFRGMSTATLSLACRATGRRVLVFDSFEGLPPPAAQGVSIADGSVLPWREGDFAGSLEEVRRNVSAYGAIEACEFVPGYFEDTLPSRPATERYVLIFEDADLTTSVRDVLRYAWPRLHDGCVFFTHEARDLMVTMIFFDEEFWLKELNSAPPGLVGSGLGLTFAAIGSCLGYAIKRPRSEPAAAASRPADHADRVPE